MSTRAAGDDQIMTLMPQVFSNIHDVLKAQDEVDMSLENISAAVKELVSVTGVHGNLPNRLHAPVLPLPVARVLLAQLKPLVPDTAPRPTEASWPRDLLRCLGGLNEKAYAADRIAVWRKHDGWASVARGACICGQLNLAMDIARERPRSKSIAYFAAEAALGHSRPELARPLLPHAAGRAHPSMLMWLPVAVTLWLGSVGYGQI